MPQLTAIGRRLARTDGGRELRLVADPPVASRSAGDRTVVELDGVRKTYSGGKNERLTVLDQIDLEIPAGSGTLIEGPSGSGKTTLLGLIGCLIRPTSGRVRIDGRETSLLTENQLSDLRRHRLGIVFQSCHLIRGVSALENVTIPALPRPEVDGELGPRARRLLGRLGLESRSRVAVERLSGGEQQRVAMARALINDPAVLLADEPTAHLDPGTSSIFLGLLEELLDEGRSVVVASHDPALRSSALFDRRWALDAGRLREAGGR